MEHRPVAIRLRPEELRKRLDEIMTSCFERGATFSVVPRHDNTMYDVVIGGVVRHVFESSGTFAQVETRLRNSIGQLARVVDMGHSVADKLDFACATADELASYIEELRAGN